MSPATGPTPLSERALAPDLARGVMLLFIALANSHYFLQAPVVRGGFPQDTGLWTLRWKDRWLLIVAAGFLLLTLLPADSDLSGSTSALGPDPSMLPPDLGTQIAERMTVWPWIALLGPIGFACPFLIGVWAGRRRILEQPERYRGLLIGTAVMGIGIAVAGAQPAALLTGRFIDQPGEGALGFWGPLHDATGVLGGLGYAALIALIAAELEVQRTRHDSQQRLVQALAATGQRSLTCYLAQSAVWSAVFTPYLLDFSDRLSVTATVLLALATWLATVVIADSMRSLGQRGWPETFVRRITYGGVRKSSR